MKVKGAKVVEVWTECNCCGLRYKRSQIIAIMEDDTENPHLSWVKSCPMCGALNAEHQPEENAFLFVKDEFSDLPFDPEEQLYYNISYYKEDTGELRRRHGWFDRRNLKITQAG